MRRNDFNYIHEATVEAKYLGFSKSCEILYGSLKYVIAFANSLKAFLTAIRFIKDYKAI